MEDVSITGIDLAKRSFQRHGARADGSVAFRRKLSRDTVLGVMASQPRCVVAMEACASAHHGGREIRKLGHAVKLVPPIYVKPFVKRQKNDAADAEAICEAASRPTMRFVAVKTQAQQARGMLFRTRDLLVRQRTQTINAVRGHVAEFGVVAPRGPAHLGRLSAAIDDAESGLPDPVRELGALLLDQVAELDAKIAGLELELRARARDDEQTVRLMSIPGIGPITALAIQACAPPMESFRRGRDFSAWLGLVPQQHSTGGKPEARHDIQDGPARSPAAVDRRRDDDDPLGGAPRCHEGPLAGPDADAQAAHAGRRGAGQPDGPHRLGADDEERTRPAGRHCLRRHEAVRRCRECEQVGGGSGQTVNRDGVGKTQRLGSCLGAHSADVGSDPRISIQARGA